MRELLALGLVLLVTVNTVNSGAIFRRYRGLDLPAGDADAEALPAESYVAQLRKDQIPVQVVEVVEPVVVVKPVLRSVEPAITIAEAEPAAVITNEIIPEKVEKLEEEIETVRAIEQVVAEEAELAQPVAEAVAEAIVKQEEQQLRNIEPETPVVPAVVLVEQAAEPQKQEELPAVAAAEKKLLPEALPEALPELLPKESVPAAVVEDLKAEEAKPLEANLPAVKAIKEDAPSYDIAPEVQAAEKVLLPDVFEAQSEPKPLEENAAPVEIKPEVKSLKEEEPLMEVPKEEQLLEKRKEELLEKKKEERREEKKEELKELKEEKKEILKAVIEDAIKEEIKEELAEKIQAEIQETPKESEELAPSAKQADTADPGPTTARPAQPGFIQQLVQNSPFGQLFNTLNGQAASEENTPVATAASFIQALQNTTSQITNTIQQGFQQQFQSLQSTFSGQQPQQAAAAGDAAAASTARPQGPLQSIVTSFLGNGAQPQQPAAAASQQQPAGPLQGILNLFGGNRAPSVGAAPAAAASSTPAAESVPANDEVESAPSEAAAAEEASPEIVRDSNEAADDNSQEEPGEIIISDDGTHE